MGKSSELIRRLIRARARRIAGIAALCAVPVAACIGISAQNQSKAPVIAPPPPAAYPAATAPIDTVALPMPVGGTVPRSYEELMADEMAYDLDMPSNISTTAEYDPATGCYVVRTRVGDIDIATPFMLSKAQYDNWQLRRSMQQYYRERNSIVAENKDKQPFNILDMNFALGPLEKIFGPGGVQLRTQGSVQVAMGIKSNKTDNPALSLRSRRKTYFDFDQKIQATINASVGDRLKFNMTYNTDATFDFDSKNLKLAYEGKEDDIVKSIEAGNVSMTTGSSLIRGSTALFGVKTKLQFGKLTATALVSQQQSESKSVSSRGGSQTTKFTVNADEYDANRHFFLAHFFRDNYDRFASKLPYVISGVKITRIEVWVTNKGGKYEQSRNLVAFQDLGEDSHLASSYWQPNPALPNTANSSNNLLSVIKTDYPGARNINTVTQALEPLSAYGIEGGSDYEKVESARLLSSSEYTLNSTLGYISLKSAHSADEVLAVAYEYTYNGQVYQVGEFSGDITTTDQSLYVKMLKSTTTTPAMPVWDLMMKNVYNLGAYQIQKQNFRLNIKYLSDTTGTQINYLPVPGLNNKPLLQVMNLDRIDSNEQSNPDGFFDFIEGYTIYSQRARSSSPWSSPSASIWRENQQPRAGQPVRLPGALRLHAHRGPPVCRQEQIRAHGRISGIVRLADTPQRHERAPRLGDRHRRRRHPDRELRLYRRLRHGHSHHHQPEHHRLGPERQRHAREPVDVLHPAQDAAGPRPAVQFNKNLNLGATILHFSEKALTEKVNIGDETVNNSMFGLNLSYNQEFMWLTNLLNKIPTVNATAPSRLSLTAEYARIIPHAQKSGATRARAMSTTSSRPRPASTCARPTHGFSPPPPTTPAPTPSSPRPALSNNVDYGKNRALLNWYYIDRMFTQRNSSLAPGYIKSDLKQLSNPYVREVYTREIFPGREHTYGESATIQTLNLSFYPTERGPYNLDATNIDDEGNLLNPERRWGGIMRKLDNTNFEQSNIEYVQFWMLNPFLDPENPNLEGGDLYFNFGEISEDILKDGLKSYENGIPVDGDDQYLEETVWGRVSRQNSLTYASTTPTAHASSRTWASTDCPTRWSTATTATASISSSCADASRPRPWSACRPTSSRRSTTPPATTTTSTADYDYDEERLGVLARYKRYNGVEGNSLNPDEAADPLYQSAKSGPDVEDINQDNTLNEYERYFQYKVSIRPEDLVVGKNYITDRQERMQRTPDGKDLRVEWFQFKIPLSDYERIVGSIRDFSTIRFARMFMTGFKAVTHLRFATLELVRGEWRPYDFNLNTRGDAPAEGQLDISVVNIEENSRREPVNYVLPPASPASPTPARAR